jgi:hypothetical protein
MLLGSLTPAVVLWIVAANAVFGIVAGYLFGRYRLEAAMVAHATAHVLGFAVGWSFSS